MTRPFNSAGNKKLWKGELFVLTQGLVFHLWPSNSLSSLGSLWTSDPLEYWDTGTGIKSSFFHVGEGEQSLGHARPKILTAETQSRPHLLFFILGMEPTELLAQHGRSVQSSLRKHQPPLPSILPHISFPGELQRNLAWKSGTLTRYKRYLGDLEIGGTTQGAAAAHQQWFSCGSSGLHTDNGPPLSAGHTLLRISPHLHDSHTQGCLLNAWNISPFLLLLQDTLSHPHLYPSCHHSE